MKELVIGVFVLARYCAFSRSVENYGNPKIDIALFDSRLWTLFVISREMQDDSSIVDPVMTPEQLVDFHKIWCVMPLRAPRFHRQFFI